MSQDFERDIGLKGSTPDKFAALTVAAAMFVEDFIGIDVLVAVASMTSPGCGCCPCDD